MATFSPELAARVARRHGIVTSDELLADGHAISAVRYLTRHGALITVHRGVHRLATSPDTFSSRCAAVCAADPSAAITGVSAAALWEFRHVWRPQLPHVLVAHDRTPLVHGVVLRRSNVIDAGDVVDRPDGIRVTSPPRAWFECARDIDDERFERLTEWVLDHHSNVPTLWRTAARLCAHGRPGSARVRRVMERRTDWQKPADSGLELRVLTALRRRGIELVQQHAVVLGDRSVIHLDGADPEIRWGVEIDHVTWHGGRLDAQRDKARDRAARLVGWQIERVTDHDVADDMAGTIDELVRLHELRRTAVAV